jgi:hypothetical protein
MWKSSTPRVGGWWIEPKDNDCYDVARIIIRCLMIADSVNPSEKNKASGGKR